MSRPVTRRSKGSILKSLKSSETENAPETPGESNARRVSFAASNFVKPFSEDPEQVTVWDDTYEEEMKHSDSIEDSTASSLALTVTEDTSEINLTRTTTRKITEPKILDKENLIPVEIPKKTRKSTNVKKNKDFDIFDSSDEDCSFLSDRVELKKYNQVLVESKENIRIFEDSEELKDKDGKITIFDDSQVDMEQTARLPTLIILPVNDKDNNVKTLVFEDSQANMDFPSVESRRKTIVFNESQADLEMTGSLPTLPIPPVNNEDNKMKTKIFKDSQANMDFTSVDTKDEKIFTPEAVKKSGFQEEILTYKPIDMRLYKAKLLEKLKPSLEQLQNVHDDMKNIRFVEPSVDIDSSTESEEKTILEDKPKTILEKIQEADERSGLFWTFDHHEASTYFFTTFNRNARLSVDIDSQDYVTNVTTSLHVPEGSYAVAKLQLNFFIDKMKKERIESALGTKYDILGLLDYVYMHVKEIHLAGFRLLTGIQKNHRLRVNDDMVVYFRVLSIELIIAREFEVDMLNIHEPKIVTARSLFGTPMNEEKIRKLAMYCPTGLHFIEKYIEKILEYCETDIRSQLIESGDI